MEIDKNHNEYLNHLVKFAENNFFLSKKTITRVNSTLDNDFNEKIIKLFFKQDNKQEMKALIFISVIMLILQNLSNFFKKKFSKRLRGFMNYEEKQQLQLKKTFLIFLNKIVIEYFHALALKALYILISEKIWKSYFEIQKDQSKNLKRNIVF